MKLQVESLFLRRKKFHHICFRLSLSSVLWTVPNLCRCIQRQYEYAGLTKATCMCAHTLANTTEAWAVGKRTCTKTCPGNMLQKCGHTGRLDVWKTGLVSESSGLVLTTELVWLNVFDADLSPERYWRGTRIPKSGKEGDYT